MVKNVSGTYTLVPDASWQDLQTDEIRLLCDTSLAPVIINMPTIAALNGFWNVKILVVDKSQNAAVNNITINATGGNNIGSDTTEVINKNGGAIELQVLSLTNWLATLSAEMTGGSAPSGAFIYKPSGVAAGNLYTDWALLWAAIIVTKGVQLIWIDEDAPINSLAPVNYDFENRITLSAKLGVTATNLLFGDNVTIVNLALVKGSLTLVSGSTTGAVYNALAGTSLTFEDGGAIGVQDGMQPFYKADGAGTRNVYFNGRSNTIKASVAFSPAMNASNGATIEIRLQGQKGTVTPYALTTDDGSNLGTRIRFWDYGNPNGLISIGQPTFVPNGALHYPRVDREVFDFGGNMVDPMNLNQWLRVNADSDLNPSASQDQTSQAVVGTENQLRQIIWNSASADNTTVLEVEVQGSVNGSFILPVTLTGPSGALSLLANSGAPNYTTKFCVLGDKISVRWIGGTGPNGMTVRIA
jgi:hypothetical protein